MVSVISVVLMMAFLNLSAENNKSIKNTKQTVKNLNPVEPTKATHISYREKYRTGTEWLSLGFAMGNYGIGLNISFFTIRWKYFYWEMLRFQGMLSHTIFNGDRGSANAKTTFGFPLFLTHDNRHELRFGLGASGGVSLRQFSNGPGNRSDEFFSYLNVPFEVSYVFHVAKNFAFQTGLSLDFPVFYEFDNKFNNNEKYIPIFSFFLGFRI